MVGRRLSRAAERHFEASSVWGGGGIAKAGPRARSLNDRERDSIARMWQSGLERSAIVSQMDPEIAAKASRRRSRLVQAAGVEMMRTEEAADMLEAMEPDEVGTASPEERQNVSLRTGPVRSKFQRLVATRGRVRLPLIETLRGQVALR
jgi:hypothetical protein